MRKRPIQKGRTNIHNKEMMIETASAFREADYRVFPLHEIKDGLCTCHRGSDCSDAGKHPVAASWQHTPQWSDEQWEVMTVEYPQIKTGYGVVCRGLLVVDVDARNGGIASYEKLLEAVPEIAGAGLIVNTGSGNGSKHLYFRVDPDIALMSHLPNYPGLDFKASGYVVGPGSLHKSGAVYEIAYGSPDEIEGAPRVLIEMLRKPERHRAEYEGRALDVSHSDIAEMVSFIEPDCDYETWIRVGMAIHDALGGDGFDIWDEWSRKGDKYEADNMDSHWHSFGKSSNPVRIGTLIHYAEAGGWKMPVTFSSDGFDFSVPDEEEAPIDGLPFDISSVDLKRPPGFVGQLATWIEAQSRRPRENLAVAAALVGLGNVAGLKYTDDLDGVTTNLFAFCIAGSRTGKESVQQSIGQIHRAAGIAAATHGSIKSEQEITRNLLRHQAALYVVDEIGIFLQKIKNAQRKGGASYLDGVIGMLMQAYSKTDGFMLLTGDGKEELRQGLQNELSKVCRKIDENEGGRWAEKKRDQLTRALANIDKGLEKPFLSMVGFTTPVTFESLVDFEQATNGFIGRSLLFNERETAPRSKKNFSKTPMPDSMAMTLMGLYGAGSFSYDEESERIEYYGERRQIETATNAKELLDRSVDWLEDQAVAQKSKTGLESLYLGAYELVSKVSLILAIPEGLRTAEHVRWAFALVKRDIEEKSRLVVANDREKTDPGVSLAAKIMNLISDEGERIGTIRNRLRSHRKEDVDKMLDELEKAGKCEKTSIEYQKGKKTFHYKAL